MSSTLNFSGEIAGLTEMAERQHAIHLRNTRSLVNGCKELLQKKKEEIEAYMFECEELIRVKGDRLDKREEALKKREQYVIEGETSLQERTRDIVQKERELYEREQAFDAKISRARETLEGVISFEKPKLPNTSRTDFMQVDLSTMADGYDKPVCGAFLQGYVRPEGKTHGSPLVFKTFDAAVRAANELGDACAGIRMEPDDKRYTLQTGTYYGRRTGLVKPLSHNKRYRTNWVTWCKSSLALIPFPEPTPAPTTNTPYATASESSDDEDEIEVESWKYEGTTYLVDTKTNQVYDAETQDLVGQRLGGNKLAKF